jgi:hypothetical protein
MDVAEFKNRIAQIYKIADELGRAFNIDTCTPDGHLLGAIGQIAASIAFNLQFGSEKEEHNCTWSGGERKVNVQVRCSGRGSIALRKEPEYLIAVEIGKTGRIKLLFNGPGEYAWGRIVHQKSAQKCINSSALFEAQKEVDSKESKIPIVEDIFDS